MPDAQTAYIRDALELGNLVVPDVAAYEHLADYELEASEFGYPIVLGAKRPSNSRSHRGFAMKSNSARPRSSSAVLICPIVDV